MHKSLSYIVLFVFLFAGTSPARAQELPVVKATIDKNNILIGEPIRFMIDVKSPMSSGTLLPQFDSIPHFELIEKANRDSLISSMGASYHLEWKLTSFDSGTRVIPAFSVSIGNQVFKTDSLAVEVSYGKMNSAQDYHDIKGIRDLENPDVKYISWIVGALTLVSLVLFYWFFRHPFAKEKVVEKSFGSRISPMDDALANLEQLKKMLREDPSAIKKYYTGLTDTLRIFLNRQKGLITMEKTSEELIVSLSNLKLETESFSALTSTLRMGDFVKFAKYVPGPFENDSNLEVIRSAIVTINETGK